MSYLVDTDVVIEYFKGRPFGLRVISGLIDSDLAMSVITLGELYEGIYYGQDRARHEEKLELLLESVAVLEVTNDIAIRFAMIRGELRRGGMLIPHPDILIAATAIHHKRELVTRNLRHYVRIPELSIYVSSYTIRDPQF